MLVSEAGQSTPPFILFDEMRDSAASASRLYRSPMAILQAHCAEDIAPLLAQLEEAGRNGLHAAGYLHYEAGEALALTGRELAEVGLRAHVGTSAGAGMNAGAVGRSSADAGADTQSKAPIAWFGLFQEVERLSADQVAERLPDAASAWVGAPRPRVSRKAYLAKVESLLEYIRAGDIYQANYTFGADVPFAGPPLAVYARLRQTAKAGYGAFIWTGSQAIASLSPELFFTLREGQVMARPMKGTAARQADAMADAEVARQLAQDPKQRAENLMIVDLIRNDLSRVAEAGSVKVPDLFRVESFPTIHQLVSDVTAHLPDDKNAVDMLRAAFPCGSITGAPKIRAMEILQQSEAEERGLYTGSIGFIEPSGDAAFNVAIRTLVFPNLTFNKYGAAWASMGLGSGIVADSQPEEEWRECLAKGDFVTAAGEDFDLLETMAFDPVEGLVRLERHLQRLSTSAAELGFTFHRHHLRNQLQAATFRVRVPSKVRLRLARSGALAVEISPMPAAGNDRVKVMMMAAPLDAGDFRVRHKTSLRCAYDQARGRSGAGEVVFVNDDGFVTEGSYSNIFVERDGMMLTPPLQHGLLPGVLRAELLDGGQAAESPLRPTDLENGFWLGNSLRGLRAAILEKISA